MAVSSKNIGGDVEHIRKIRRIIDSLKEKDVYSDSVDGFIDDKNAIINIFKLTNNSKVEDVLLRLTVIDSMYSTQMNRRYYALDELADKMVRTHSGSESFLKFLKNMILHFSMVVKGKKLSIFGVRNMV